MQPPFMGTPSYNYNPMGTGNPNIDMAFAQYMPMLMPQFFGGGKFLPQQFPSQAIMDQMVSAKYQRSARANMNAARATDQAAIYNNLTGIRSRFDPNPPSPLAAAQLNNTAGLINNPAVQGVAAMLMGPQNAEDLFFGRRGSAVQLANSVNQVGFYRPDSVTGGDRMSQQSLQAFSSQLYSHLYGPDADLNDISGFSAGRAGSMMAELGQRGLLPQSIGNMSAGDRRKAFSGVDTKAMGLSSDVVDAINKNLPTEEIAKIEGGADAVRKIDATRVGNSLKEYGKALSAVREIFGDNGITNAPMQQLMAAMDSLTQSGGASMAPGKLENMLRRTQMASRDSGVSLEALMGLSARGGALAQQYGLSPEMAAESTIAAMETGRALRDTGGFAPGFGRLDANKAVLFAQEQNMQVDASKVGRYSGAIARIVAENEGNAAFKGTKMRSFVEALKRGDTTFYDPDQQRNVSITEELGRNPDKFVGDMLGQAGISVSHFDSLVRDPNTQEFQREIAGRLAGAQNVEMKEKIGQHLAFNTGLTSRIGGGLNDDQKSALSGRIGQALGAALVDDVSTANMTPQERLATLRRSFKIAAIDDVAARTGLKGAAAEAEAAKIFQVGADNILGFKTEDDLNNMLSQTTAEAGIFTQGQFGMALPQIQQMMNSQLAAEKEKRSRTNISRAGLASNLDLDGGSNFIQRLSDSLGDKSKPILDNVLGAIDSVEYQDKLISAISGGKDNVEKRAKLEGVFKEMQREYDVGTVNTAEEKAAMLAGVTDDESFKKAAEQFKGTAAESAFAGKTSYISSNTLAGNIETSVAGLTGGTDKIKQIYSRHNRDKSQKQIDEIFADPAKAKEAYLSLADNAGAYTELETAGISLGIGGDAMTQAQLRGYNSRTDAFGARLTDADRAKIAAFGQLGRQMDIGEVRAASILGAYGDEDLAKDETLTQKLNSYLKNESGGNIDDVTASLKAAGLGADQIDKIQTSAEFSRKLNDMGGFGALGGAGFTATAAGAGRMLALEKAVDVNADGGPKLKGKLADAINAKDKATPEQKKLIADAEAAAKAGEKDFATFVEQNADATDTAKNRVTTVKEIEAEAQKTTEAQTGAAKAGADPLGIGAALSSSLSGALASAFKNEIKIEKLTVASLEMPKNLIENLLSSTTEQTAKSASEIALAGTLTIKNLREAVVAATGTQEMEQTNGAPVGQA